MLKQLIAEIKKDRPTSNIIYVDKELKGSSTIKNDDHLHEYVQSTGIR